MKNLKNYIKDYINESVWDIEDNIDDDNEESILNDIKKFIEDNCMSIKLNRCKFVFDEKKDKYVVNCDQHVYLSPNIEQLTNGMFEWGVVEGDFDCAYCSKLTSLEDAPETVGGDFNCSGCSKLTTLKGVPEIIVGDFGCRDCENLTSLKDAPKEVGGTFSCSKCPKLKNLEGASKKVGGNFYCHKCSKLKNLEGAPKEVGGDFFCKDCPNLHSLDGIGKVRGKIFSDME